MLLKSSTSQAQSQSQSQPRRSPGTASAWHQSPPLPLLLLCVLLLMPRLLLGDEAAADDVGVAVTWGHVNKYATRIHEQEVLLPADSNGSNGIKNNGNGNSTATVVIRYPTEVAEQSSYTITAVHAYDSTVYDADAGTDVHFGVGFGVGGGVDTAPSAAACLKCVTIELLSGGVGYKYTALGFHRAQSAYRGDIHYKLVIYGLEL